MNRDFCMKRIHALRIGGLALGLYACSAAAAPAIEADKLIKSFGTVPEGKKAKTTFTLSNTGDEPLRITGVRPSCGCIASVYDTLIPPGESGAIESEITFGTFSGTFDKFLMVTSNAKETPTLRLTVRGTVTPIIGISEKPLAITAGAGGGSTKTLHFTCAKRDLRMTAASFDKDAPPWQKNGPMPLDYRWQPTDSTTKDGLRAYRLTLTIPPMDAPRTSGVFIFETNHEKRTELRIRGTITRE